MPNVVAHFGAQAPLLRGFARQEHLRWLLLGCVMPDLPWIFRRALAAAPGLELHPVALRLYAMVQATLIFSLLLAAAIALLTERPARIFAVLGIASLLHLLVDAAQTKWGNGVHLLAPVRWETLNVGWFWPESWPTVMLTAAGVLYLAVEWGGGQRDRERTSRSHTRFRTGVFDGRIASGGLALVAYFALPPLFMPAALASDSHSLLTLTRADERAGRPVAFDRAGFRPGDGGGSLYYVGDTLRVTGDLPRSAATISVRGVFADRDTLRAHAVHVHAGRIRDWASILGLIVLVGVWWRSLPGRGERARRRCPRAEEPRSRKAP